MKCRNCSTENKDGEMFCFLCGAKLDKEEAATDIVINVANAPKASETTNILGGSEPMPAKAASENFAQDAKNESVPEKKKIPMGIILGVIIGLAVIVIGVAIILFIILGKSNDGGGASDGAVKNTGKSSYDYYEECEDTFLDMDTGEYLDETSSVALGITAMDWWTEDEYPDGVLVIDMYPYGACAEAGIEEGDTIIYLGYMSIEDVYDLMEYKGYYKPGDNAVVGVLRYDEDYEDYDYLEFTVTFQRAR